MYSIVITLIYCAFICLGLPDGLLGAAWPVMSVEMSLPLAGAGVISTIIAAGTIVSSLLSDKITRKFGAGPVTAVSIALSATALVGFSLSKSFILLCLIAVPYGLSAGAVDAALNNYVALHYSSRHMSWLHCFWGLGAVAGPIVMGEILSRGKSWNLGYGMVSIVQLALATVLFLSLGKWKKRSENQQDSENYEAPIGITDALKIKGVKAILAAFFGCCAFEGVTMLWTSSYLVEHKFLPPEIAASFSSMFLIGITVGRFLAGFVCNRIGDKNMIRIGLFIVTLGTLLVLVPMENVAVAISGLVLTGLGSAPIYPSIIHSTPDHFGRENSHAIVGIQMASAYLGSMLAPPVFGFFAQHLSIALFPMFLLLFDLLMIFMLERVNAVTKK